MGVWRATSEKKSHKNASQIKQKHERRKQEKKRESRTHIRSPRNCHMEQMRAKGTRYDIKRKKKTKMKHKKHITKSDFFGLVVKRTSLARASYSGRFLHTVYIRFCKLSLSFSHTFGAHLFSFRCSVFCYFPFLHTFFPLSVIQSTPYLMFISNIRYDIPCHANV